MEIAEEKTKRKKKKIGKIVAIVFFVIVAILVMAVWFGLSTLDDVDSNASGTDIDFTSSTWVSKAEGAAKKYINDIYNKGAAFTYDATQERGWFVELEYDYSIDDYYKSNDFTYGYYVCEGAIQYDVPGDGSSKLCPVNYTATVFATDNANDYRFTLRTITLTYDGVEIDNYKNSDFFTQ